MTGARDPEFSALVQGQRAFREEHRMDCVPLHGLQKKEPLPDHRLSPGENIEVANGLVSDYDQSIRITIL